MGAVLSRWRKWGDPQRAVDWVASELMGTPTGALRLVASFAGIGTTMGLSDKVPRVIVSVPVKPIAEFADLKAVASLVREVRDEELTEREREIKSKFLRAMDEIAAGKSPDAVPFRDDF